MLYKKSKINLSIPAMRFFHLHRLKGSPKKSYFLNGSTLKGNKENRELC